MKLPEGRADKLLMFMPLLLKSRQRPTLSQSVAPPVNRLYTKLASASELQTRRLSTSIPAACNRICRHRKSRRRRWRTRLPVRQASQAYPGFVRCIRSKSSELLPKRLCSTGRRLALLARSATFVVVVLNGTSLSALPSHDPSMPCAV